MCTHLNNFLLWSADDNYTLLHGTQTMHRGEETDGWILVDGLVPFSNYTVQVNVSNSQGSLISDPVMIAMPPGGKSLHSTGSPNVCKRPRTKSPWNTWFVVSIIIIFFLQLLSCVSGCLGGGCILWRPFYWHRFMETTFSSHAASVSWCVCIRTYSSCFMHVRKIRKCFFVWDFLESQNLYFQFEL